MPLFAFKLRAHPENRLTTNKMFDIGDDFDDQHSDTLVWAVHGNFNCKRHADVKIYLGEIELPAHGIVLASQSKYFKKALESTMKEGIERKFEFREGSMHAYWRLFEYIYKGEYYHDAAVALSSIADDDELVQDIRVYQLADYFQVDNLQSYALEMFKSKIDKLWVGENFVDCIRDVYGTTIDRHHVLRLEVAKVARSHLRDLWDKQTFRDLIREGGDFVMDVLKGVVAAPSAIKERVSGQPKKAS
ncbi:BTB/POZ protein [Trichoderma chlorosporum]